MDDHVPYGAATSIVLLLAAAGVGPPGGSAASPAAPQTVGVSSAALPASDTVRRAPASAWRQYADPAEAGFVPDGLRAVCARADSLRSGALMAVWRGHVVLACGAVDREFRAHSVRKSLVSGLYGTAVARGEIDLDASLAELGVDEELPLTPSERRATVRDLLAARSGVYRPAAYAPESQERERPARGSHDPGTYWFYNNWDFNVAGVIYERATGEGLYASFARRIAAPLGMEDWDAEDGFRVYEPTRSRHPAHTFRISARDLARFGQLYLQRGRWNGEQIVPASWIRESTRAHSRLGDGRGYGYMWWTYAAGSLDGASYPALSDHDVYMGRGSGGQGLWVVPGAGLVVVHRGDTDHGDGVNGADAWGLVERILAARTGRAATDPALEKLDPVSLASQAPPPEVPEYRDLPDGALEEYVGRYAVAPDTAIRVFRFRGRPYVHVPGEGDALLFPRGGDRFTLRVVSGVEVVFRRDARGEVEEIVLTLGPREIRAAKAR